MDAKTAARSRLYALLMGLVSALALLSAHAAHAALPPEAIDALLEGRTIAWEPVKLQAIWSTRSAQKALERACGLRSSTPKAS